MANTSQQISAATTPAPTSPTTPAQPRSCARPSIPEDTPCGSASFVEQLGIVGWAPLEPIILAALALETPVLLVGPHGIAKSLIVERLAAALGLRFGHYNTALLCYDDLVGIPMPAPEGGMLEFARTPAAIWDVGFVFFDEISRGRPDIQNKVFPIVHERRVMGIDLDNLRQCWAAMNPPASRKSAELGEFSYSGSEELDPALADRFGFVIRVPSWDDLSQEEKERVVCKRRTNPGTSSHLDLAGLCQQTREVLTLVDAQLRGIVATYVVLLLDALRGAKVSLSPRRGNMLVEMILAVHAAHIVLGQEHMYFEDSALVTLRHAIPQYADSQPTPERKILAAHRQAREVLSIPEDNPLRRVLAECDPLRRLEIAEELDVGDEFLSRLVTMALSRCSSEAHQVALSTALFLRYRDRRNLLPSAFTALQSGAKFLLDPHANTHRLNEAGRKVYLELLHDLPDFEEQQVPSFARFRNNIRLHGASQEWSREDILQAEEALLDHLKRFAPEHLEREVA